MALIARGKRENLTGSATAPSRAERRSWTGAHNRARTVQFMTPSSLRGCFQGGVQRAYARKDFCASSSVPDAALVGCTSSARRLLRIGHPLTERRALKEMIAAAAGIAGGGEKGPQSMARVFAACEPRQRMVLAIDERTGCHLSRWFTKSRLMVPFLNWRSGFGNALSKPLPP